MIYRGFLFFKILVCLFLFGQTAKAQLYVVSNKHDFGTLQGDDKRYTDFIVINVGKNPINLLRIETFRDRELQTKMSDVYLLSSDTAIIRVQINPLVEGKFNKKFELYHSFSNKPIDFTVKGETKNLNDLQRQACPDFNDRRSAKVKAEFDYTVLVSDAITGDAIKSANVSFDQVDNGKRDDKSTNKNGECSFETNPGRVEVVIKADGYETIVRREFLKRSDRLLEVQLYTKLYVQTGKYENPAENKEKETREITENPEPELVENEFTYGEKEIETNTVYLEETSKLKTKAKPKSTISPKPEEDSNNEINYGGKSINTDFLNEEIETTPTPEINDKEEPEPVVDAVKPESKFDVNNTAVEKTIEPIINPTSKAKQAEKALKAAETIGFEESKYKANNVVFLIDKSISMGNDKKLDITKKAVLYLINWFRPIDQLGVVVYDSDAKILIPSANGNEVKSQQKEIQDLSASGKTYGAKGLREALEMDEKNYLDNGVNQIFVITDGAFSEDIDKVKRVAKRCAKKGIQLHFIGVKNQKYTEKAFVEMADISNGDYIHLSDINEAEQQLFDYIKKNSSLQ